MADRPFEIEYFEGNAKAKTADLFNTMNEHLSPDVVAVNTKVLEELLKKGRATLRLLFKMRLTDMNTLYQQCGGDLGFVQTLQDTTEMKFATDEAPGASHEDNTGMLATLADPSSQVRTNPRTGVPTDNVSSRLTSDDIEDLDLPEHVFSGIKTKDPHINAIGEPELEAFTDAIVAHILCEYGDLKAGLPLARHFGSLAKARLTLPNYGNTAGEDRNIGNMIFYKCKNRLYVCEAPLPPPPAPPPAPPTPDPTPTPGQFNSFTLAERRQIQASPHREQRGLDRRGPRTHSSKPSVGRVHQNLHDGNCKKGSACEERADEAVAATNAVAATGGCFTLH